MKYECFALKTFDSFPETINLFNLVEIVTVEARQVIQLSEIPVFFSLVFKIPFKWFP